MHVEALPGDTAESVAVAVAERRAERSRWGAALTVLGHLVGVAIIAGYTAFLVAHFQAAISEPDDNGYFAQGSLMATKGTTILKPESDAQYIGMHWLLTSMEKGDEQYISRYPPGLPALIAVVYKIGGYKAAAAVNPALAVGALIGLYLLMCRVVPVPFALAGLVLVAMNPTFTHHALDGDSHMGVTFCVLWALYFMMLWSKEGKLWQVGLAGLFLGCIPTVRYGDVVMGTGAAAFFLWHIRKFPQIWKHYAVAIGCAIVPVLPMLIRNQIVMHAFWRTGYSLTNEETGFSWAFFKAHAVDYLQQVQGAGIGMFFALGVAGMVWMVCVKRTRALGSMLLLATTSMLVLYMAYYWAPQMNSQMTMRFLLPTFPLYVIAGLWILAEAMKSAPMGARIAVPAVVVAVQLCWGTNTMVEETTQGTYQRQILATVTRDMEKYVPAGSVVLTDGHTLQDLDFVRIWKTADMSLVGVGSRGFAMGGGGNFNGRRGGGANNRRGNNRGGGGGFGGMGGDNNAPSPRQEEKTVVEREKYTGTTDDRIDKFQKDLRTWAGSKTVYFVGTREEMESTLGNIADMRDVGVIATLPLPPEPDAPAREGLMGAGMPPGGPGGPGGAFMNRRRGGGGGGGGMFGSAMAGDTDFVIAQWNVPNG
jgi:uncharacterized membrane protein